MSDKSLQRRLPIDRPCSQCLGGDWEMKHHMHSPPFREGYGEADEPPAAPDGGETLEQLAHHCAREAMLSKHLHLSNPSQIIQVMAKAIEPVLRDHSRRREEGIDVTEIINKYFPASPGAEIAWTPEDENRRNCYLALCDQARQQEERIKELEQWKREMLESAKQWDSVIEYLQAHFDAKELGGTWQEAVLRRLRERDAALGDKEHAEECAKMSKQAVESAERERTYADLIAIGRKEGMNGEWHCYCPGCEAIRKLAEEGAVR